MGRIIDEIGNGVDVLEVVDDDEVVLLIFVDDDVWLLNDIVELADEIADDDEVEVLDDVDWFELATGDEDDEIDY